MIDNLKKDEMEHIAGAALEIQGRSYINMGSLEDSNDTLSRYEKDEANRQKAYLDFFDNSLLPKITIDSDCRITRANYAFQKLFKYTNDELAGKRLHNSVIPLELVDEAEKLCLKAFQNGFNEWETVRKTKDGQLINVHVIAFPIAANTEKTGLYIIYNDISQYKRHEEEYKKAKEDAESANRAKSQFLANMSHEIRTPLNGIKGMIDLTLMSELTEDQRENLIIASTCSDILLKVINDILDYSKIEAGKMEIDSIEFNLDELIQNIVKAHGLEIKRKGLYVNCDIEKSISNCLVGDTVKLQQIINNLFGNAVKFTDSGGIDITVKKVIHQDNKVQLLFNITDTGIGIDEDDIERLFKSFTQVDGSRTRKYGGTGLGLAISKNLIELMGGEISVKSEVGKGSSFYFTVSLLEKENCFKNDFACTPNGALIKNKKYRILVAEDNEMNQKVIRSILLKLGHEPVIVRDGKEAVKRYAQNTFDLILMDIEMPVMDGIEAAKAIRNIDRESGMHIPIIALTAHVLSGDRERFIENGMDDYISKPIIINELDRIINSNVNL